MLRIGDFSRLSRISIRMLRHYDEIKLLAPETVDTFTGYRYYSESQLPEASRIMALRGMGFGLSDIRDLLHKYHDPEKLEAYLRGKYDEILQQIRELQGQATQLETALRRIGKDGLSMNYDVVQKEIPERYVASVRQIIPAYDQEQILWNILMKETAGMNLRCDTQFRGAAVFHDEGYKERDVDVEIQMPVKGHYENTEHVVFKTVPAVLIASATYQGSYAKINEVNASVAAWLRDNGGEINGPCFSIYHVSPADTENPEELVTEICYPVKGK